MSFPYEALEKAGLKFVRVDYNGSGDEGYIEEIYSTEGGPQDEIGQRSVPELVIPEDVAEEIQSLAYDTLADRYGGWEINEGSQGHFLIDVLGRKTTLKHGNNEIHTTWFEDEVS